MFLYGAKRCLMWSTSRTGGFPSGTLVTSNTNILYFYFLHINEEHLNIQQWNSETHNTYNKHVQTKTEHQLQLTVTGIYLVQFYWPVTAHYMVSGHFIFLLSNPWSKSYVTMTARSIKSNHSTYIKLYSQFNQAHEICLISKTKYKTDGNVHVNDTWNRHVVITYFHGKGSNCTLVKLI